MYPKLKGLMAEKGITQSELAKIINVDPSTMSYKMNNKSEFTISEIKKIISYFKKTFEEIFFTNDVR